MFSIGEFSRISGLSVKALRLYHDEGILVPSVVDRDTGYRYYDFRNLEQARIVTALRDWMFSLEQIKGVLASAGDDGDLLAVLESHRALIAAKQRELNRVTSSLDTLIKREREALAIARQESFEVEEATLPTQTIAAIRTRGVYSDAGKLFPRLFKAAGSLAAGKPFSLFYDGEYKESDADFECCLPIRKAKTMEGIECRTLPGGRAFTLIHRGPYETIGRSYARLFAYMSERGLSPVLPSRELYVKGPGMIFRGNPNNYLTQLQFVVGEPAA